jgi:hypothetical protein
VQEELNDLKSHRLSTYRTLEQAASVKMQIGLLSHENAPEGRDLHMTGKAWLYEQPGACVP